MCGQINEYEIDIQRAKNNKIAEKLYKKDKKDQIRNKTITSIKIKSLNCHLFFVTPYSGTGCSLCFKSDRPPRKRQNTVFQKRGGSAAISGPCAATDIGSKVGKGLIRAFQGS